MSRRTLDWHDLDAAVAEAGRLHEQGYTAAGKWNLAQIAGHLMLVINMSMDGTDFRLPRFARWLVRVSGIRRRVFTKRKLRAGLSAPRQFQPTQTNDTAGEAAAVAAFAAAVERFKSHTGEWVMSPVFGQLDRSQWTEFHIIHAMHHFSFLTPN